MSATDSAGQLNQSVYLLWHMQPRGDGETDDKLLGIYSSREMAERRLARAKLLPGFRDQPDAFVIDEYSVDADQWTGGLKIIDD